MANLLSIPALIADLNAKITTNGAQQNTGQRVNDSVENVIETLTGAPVVSDGTPNPDSVFASASQGLLADTAVQPGDLAAVATTGDYNDLINTPPPPVTSVLLGKTLVVDAVNGNDGTAVRGDLTKPFLTLTAAQTASVSGDTILVLPGTYVNVGLLGKSGVDWFFMPNAQVTFSVHGWTNASAINYNVRGYGVFIANAGQVINFSNAAGTNCTLEFVEMSGSSALFNGLGSPQVPELTVKGHIILTNSFNVNGGVKVIGHSIKSTTSDAFRVNGGWLDVDGTIIRTDVGAGVNDITQLGTISLSNVVFEVAGNSIESASTSGPHRCMNVTGGNLSLNVTVLGTYYYHTGGAAGAVATLNADGTFSWV